MSDLYNGSYDPSKGQPSLEAAQRGQELWNDTAIASAVRVEKISVTASGTAGVDSTSIPVGAEILDVVVHANATSGSGTARVSVGGGGANITDAITMATLDAVTRCSSIDQTYKTVTSDGLTVTTNSDNDKGDIYIYYKKG